LNSVVISLMQLFCSFVSLMYSPIILLITPYYSMFLNFQCGKQTYLMHLFLRNLVRERGAPALHYNKRGKWPSW
jgi:hypothetical protein